VLTGGNNIGRVKGTTKSFRLDEDIISKIVRQAKNNNTSLNAEINNILRKYVEWDLLASKVGMVSIARPILSEIFQNIMTKEQVINLANNVAKNVIHETAHFMKGNLTLKSFLSWLKVRMEQCSELNYTMESNGPQAKVIFKHDLGENWSVYHKKILDYIFHDILRKNTILIEATDTTLILYFKELDKEYSSGQYSKQTSVPLTFSVPFS